MKDSTDNIGNISVRLRVIIYVGTVTVPVIVSALMFVISFNNKQNEKFNYIANKIDSAFYSLDKTMTVNESKSWVRDTMLVIHMRDLDTAFNQLKNKKR